MKIQHPAVTSDVFKLVTTLEFDLVVRNQFLPTRIELFQDTTRPRHFRCRMWERDLYHMQRSLSPDGERKSRRAEADEEILVERTWELSSKFDDFVAPDATKALQLFLDKLKNYLNRVAAE
ncbi:MAG: hypothetical protein HY735_37310 [Verrucomicrobia bacterium]|nr:hypothetical protein [Verrucomicrobiota bacterium]